MNAFHREILHMHNAYVPIVTVFICRDHSKERHRLEYYRNSGLYGIEDVYCEIVRLSI